MRSFWSEPFLWIHIAGLAVTPIFLALCWLGFAVGSPLLPANLDFFLVAIAGIAPILGMQMFRPFYIFSILIISLKPDHLTPVQQKILRLFKTPLHRIVAVVASVVLGGVLWPIYQAALSATPMTPLPSQWRVAGLLLASVAFLASHLFLQVPISVVSVLVTSETAFAATEPYSVEKIRQDFTIPGVQVNQILPSMTEETLPASGVVSSTPEDSSGTDAASSSSR